MTDETGFQVPAWLEKGVLAKMPTTRITHVHELRSSGMRRSAIVFTDQGMLVAEKRGGGARTYDVPFPPGLVVNGANCPHCGKVIREPVRKVATLADAASDKGAAKSGSAKKSGKKR